MFVDEMKESLLIFAVCYLPGYLAQQRPFDPELLYSAAYQTGYLVTVLPQIVLLWYLVNRRGNDATCGFVPVRPIDALRTMVVTSGLLAIAVAVFMLEPRSTVTANGTDTGAVTGSIPQIVLLALTSLATGYREEIYFRGHLVHALDAQGLRRGTAVAASSLLFGAGHVYQGTEAFLGTIAMALFLHWHLAKYRNIHALAVGHGIYNYIILTARRGFV